MNRTLSIAVVVVLAVLVPILTGIPVRQKAKDHHAQGKGRTVESSGRRVTKKTENHKTSNLYHGKSHKRNIRKKKQFIIPGMGMGMGGYGNGMAALGMTGAGLAYGAPGATNAAYGYPGTGTTGFSQAMVPNQGYIQPQGTGATGFSQAMVPSQGYMQPQALSLSQGLQGHSRGVQGSLQSRQSLLGGYSTGAGLADYAGTLGASAATYASDANLQAPSATGLSNSLGAYTGAADSGSLGNTINSLVSSYSHEGGSDMGGVGGLGSMGKISASSLSAGLDSPNGISNVASLLSSENTAFDTDSQELNSLTQRLNSAASLSQLLGNQVGQTAGSQSFTSQALEGQSQGGSQSLGLPSFSQPSPLSAEAQEFNSQLNHLTPGKLNLEESEHARPQAYTQSNLEAEAQAFNDQLSHLSNAKINTESEGSEHSSNYGGYGDSPTESTGISQLGQLANTGISDSMLQRLLGQLLAGQQHHGGGGYGGGGYDSNEGFEDSQPSLSADEQPGFSHPMFGGGNVGQTVHAHASDKPSPLSRKPASFSASHTAFQVQMKANREHQKKLKDLKLKLRKLRTKLHKLKEDYDAEDSEDQQSDLSEKSEMQTLQDLKTATEQAIRELQHEAVKAAKRKGVKKLILIHKFPDDDSGDNFDGETEIKANKNDPSLDDLQGDLLALIESDNKTGKKKTKVKQDDTASLTALEKQAEQEVNFITKKNPKVVLKQKGELHYSDSKEAKALNPGLHIHIPEPVSEEGETHSHIHNRSSSYPEMRDLARIFATRTHVQRGSTNVPDGKSVTSPQKAQESAVRAGLVEPDSDQSTENTNEEEGISHESRGYFSIGCWRDHPNHAALTSMESIFPILDGKDYKTRHFAIKKCADVAYVQGYPGFALENGGQCLGGKNILASYNKYGVSRECWQDGKGGPWSMEVYKFTVSSSPHGRRGFIPRFGGAFMPSAREIFYQSAFS